MPRKRAQKLTEDEKAKILQAYEKGVKPAAIALVLNKSQGKFTTFIAAGSLILIYLLRNNYAKQFALVEWG